MSSTAPFRGNYAPRRGRGGRAKSFSNSWRREPKPDVKKQPLGPLLKRISDSSLHLKLTQTFADVQISELHYVSSYNLRNDNSNTILVPGKPPQWTPDKAVQRLKEDSGHYYRDPNSAKYPNYPMAPTVHAILHAKPDFPTSKVDVVACGSTLGNLLRFVQGKDKAFRFAMEVIGKTVFLVRKENDPKEIIEGVRGYGHTFPEANTTWDSEVKGSESHQRIVQYKLGGFTCLVRFESDGYIKDKLPCADISTNNKGTSNTDDLLSALSNAIITKPSNTQNVICESVEIEQAGCEVPQSSIFDLKTRSGKYKADIDMSDIYPLLWIKQIPNFIVAYHDGAGLFQDVRVQDVRGDIEKWQEDNRDAICRLSILLDEIVAFARNNLEPLEVYSSGAPYLEIRRQYGQGKHALPAELRNLWANGDKYGLTLSDSDDGGCAVNESSKSEWTSNWNDEEPDYTACSAEDCNYCGHCTY